MSRLSPLFRHVDGASLAAFRVLFGAAMALSAARFLANGWVDRFFVQPSFFFKYWGFAWVGLPPWGMHVHFVGLAVLGVLVSIGLFHRAAALVFFVAFTWAQLIDVSYYLNHYYLCSLLALLLVFVPAHRTFSVDAWLRPGLRCDTVPALALYAVRFQVGVVYVCAGLAKLQSDWLLDAAPLRMWLASRTDLAVVGAWLGERWVAYAASWAGFLFDTTIVLFLSWRPSRALAFTAVVLFHVATGILFPIGMFPHIMMASATIFFAADWPRRIPGLARGTPSTTAPVRVHPWAAAALALFALGQLAMPFRHTLYGGDVLWHEQGMRFSWRVMVREKNGSVTFVVRSPATGRVWHVSPREYLLDYQEREMATQPDLIWQLAKRIARDFAARGLGVVEVRADAVVSLNGRPSAPLVDPRVDLNAVGDTLAAKPWILPAPAAHAVRFASSPP